MMNRIFKREDVHKVEEGIYKTSRRISKINSDTFKEYSDKVKVIKAPGIEEIDDEAFKDYKSLEEIYLNNIHKIGERVFEGCKELRKIKVSNKEKCEMIYEKLPYELLNQVKIYCKESRFYEIDSEGTLSTYEKEIEPFDNYEDVKTLAAGELIKIDKEIFNRLSNLQSLGVTTDAALEIDEGAFDKCNDLVEIISNGTRNCQEILRKLPYELRRQVKIYDKEKLYLSADLNGLCIIPEGVGEISKDLFQNTDRINGIEIYCEDKTEEICEIAREFVKLKAILVDEDIDETDIKEKLRNRTVMILKDKEEFDNIFYGIDLPDEQKAKLDKYIDDNGLCKIENVNTVPWRIFRKNEKIREIEISDIGYLESEAFAECYNLERVKMNNIQDMGKGVFNGCESLKEVEIKNIKTLKAETFSLCRKLESFHVDDNILEEICENVFYNCNALSKIDLPNVNIIGIGSFRNCNNLCEISIPSVIKIGKSAFENCVGLKQLSLQSIESIGIDAFKGCQSLERITVYSKESADVVRRTLKDLDNQDIKLYVFEQLDSDNEGELIESEEGSEYSSSYGSSSPESKGYEGGSEWSYSYDNYSLTSEEFEKEMGYNSNYDSSPSGSEDSEEGSEWGSSYVTSSSGTYPEEDELIEKLVSEEDEEMHEDNAINYRNAITIVLERARLVKENAFKGFDNLREVKFLSDQEIVIEDNAFSDCTVLRKVTLNKVSKVGHNAFGNCNDLEEIIVGNEESEKIMDDALKESCLQNYKINIEN